MVIKWKKIWRKQRRGENHDEEVIRDGVSAQTSKFEEELQN